MSSVADGVSEKLDREVRKVEESLKDYTKIVVETDEDNPVTIAVITANDISPADGYRVRLTPTYD